MLNNKGYCSPKSREIVLKAAKDLHYTPTHAARSLKSKKTNKVLMCVPDICNPFYFKMIKGVNDILEEHDYFMLLCYTRHSTRQELKLIQVLNERYGDGMILISFDFNEKIISSVRDCPLPIVLTNKYDNEKMLDNFDYVYVDDRKGMYLATAHLIDQGHKDIALISGSRSEQVGRERTDGYSCALRDTGIPVDESYMVESDYTREGGYNSMKKLLSRKKRMSAVVCSNDLAAIGCMEACYESHVNIPDDIAIVSMDNTDYCTCTRSALSSIDMQQEELGRTAASLLMERINEGRKRKKTIRLEPELVVRNSSHKALS
ncbi:MAG TPA: LacI family transcriptional regulator [Clostridiales bacterium]|nr:LacI family transcriptional regulator [Clostridiales bacterium]